MIYKYSASFWLNFSIKLKEQDITLVLPQKNFVMTVIVRRW